MGLLFWGVEYVASFLESAMCCFFCGTFIEKEKLRDKTKGTVILSVIGAAIVVLLNHIKIFSYINTIIFSLMYILFQWILYKKRIGFSVVLVLIYCVVVSAIDFSIVYVFSFLADLNSEYLMNQQSFVRVLCILLSKSILILTVITTNKIFKNNKVLPKKDIIMMFICSFFLLVTNCVMVKMNTENQSDEVKLMSFVFFGASLGIELLLFYFVFKIADNYEQQQNWALVEMKNKMLQKSLDDTESAFMLWRNSVHDYKNNIISLTQLAEDGNIEEIRKYLAKENQLIDKKMFCIKTGNSVVDAIVNTKQNIAEQNGISFIVNGGIPKECKISDMDLGNILGNLIDNALEACTNEQDAYIELNIRQQKNFIVIKIVNKYSGKLSKHMTTTKKDRTFHGIGIKSVKSIVEKYNGEFQMFHANNEVTTNILLLNV